MVTFVANRLANNPVITVDAYDFPGDKKCTMFAWNLIGTIDVVINHKLYEFDDKKEALEFMECYALGKPHERF